MIEQCEQNKANACIAALTERMHEDSLCPGNYNINYNHGWFQLEYGSNTFQPFRDKNLQLRANELLRRYKKTGNPTIGFSTIWNTYVVLNF